MSHRTGGRARNTGETTTPTKAVMCLGFHLSRSHLVTGEGGPARGLGLAHCFSVPLLGLRAEPWQAAGSQRTQPQLRSLGGPFNAKEKATEYFANCTLGSMLILG